MLQKQALLAQPFAMLLDPLQVLALRFLSSSPVDVRDALLPAAASGPILQRAERRGPLQAGPAGVSSEGGREPAEASLRSQR